MLTQRRLLLAALSAVAALGSTSVAHALATELIATPFTGSDTSVHILMDDTGGDIEVTLTVNEGLADLRGFFITISDFSLFDGLEVTGDDVTGFELDEGNVINLKHGINLNGGGSPCPCDLGVALGAPGIGKDDIFTTTFVLDADADLELDDFAGEVIGIRVTSVGDLGDPKDPKKKDDRGGSAKLAVGIPDPIIPIPEPTTALLLALGLGVLGRASRRR